MLFLRQIFICIGILATSVNLIASQNQKTDFDELANVVVILDSSGSMNNYMHEYGITRWQAAQSALKRVIRDIPSATRVGLLVFGAYDKGSRWLYSLGRLDVDQFDKAVNGCTPGGQTPLGASLRRGAESLLKLKKDNQGYGTYRLLVVTDGIASDPALVSRYLPTILTNGILLDVIGVGLSKKHELAEKSNSYRNANDPIALQKALAKVFAEVSDTNGVSRTLDFEILESIPYEVINSMLSSLTQRAPENAQFW